MFLLTYTPRVKPANFTGDLYACSPIEPKLINATSQTVFYEHQVKISVNIPVSGTHYVPLI